MLVVYSNMCFVFLFLFFFSSRRRHTRSTRDWSSDVCSSDLRGRARVVRRSGRHHHGGRGPPRRETRRPPGAARAARRGKLLRSHAPKAAVGRPLRPRAQVVLTELRVRDLAVIADVSLPLAPGLNVLTGETGAGKSMLVDALSLLLGERASADVVRPGAPKTVIEGAFDLSSTALDRLRHTLTAIGVKPDEARPVLHSAITCARPCRGHIM